MRMTAFPMQAMNITGTHDARHAQVEDRAHLTPIERDACGMRLTTEASGSGSRPMDGPRL
jgi:hypothetical protein